MNKICPMMSRPVVHPRQDPMSKPGATFEVECRKDDCALWDEKAQRCSYLTANLAWAEVLEEIGSNVSDDTAKQEEA